MIDKPNDHYYRKKEKENAEIALSKAKEIEAKRGKKVKFLKKGESGEFLNKKKKN